MKLCFPSIIEYRTISQLLVPYSGDTVVGIVFKELFWYHLIMFKQEPMTLTLCRGLPGSGKTSWALRQVQAHPDTVARVNRDEIRFMMFGKYVLDVKQESLITTIQHEMIKASFLAKKNVIVDDTNLNLRTVEAFYQLLVQFDGGVQLRFQDFAVGIDVCIQRDKERGERGERSVGEQVIRAMSKKYMNKSSKLPELPAKYYERIVRPNFVAQNNALPRAWICDIDGTIANMITRGPFDWDKVDEDEPIEHVIRLVHDLKKQGYKIILVSGRDAVSRKKTETWLEVYGIPYDELYMSPENDTRPDDIVKYEIYQNHIADKYYIAGVLDDRQKVVNMWRSVGLFVAQVANGMF